MKSLNLFSKIVSTILIVGLVGFLGCDSPTSSDDNMGEEVIQSESVANSFTKDGKGKKIKGQYIVVFNENVKDAGKSAEQLAKRAGGKINHIYGSSIKGFSITLPEQASPRALEALQNNPNVDFIEQDLEFSGSETQSDATWGLDRTDQRSLPIDGLYNYSLTGENVTVYIADSGINYTHQDFGGRASFGYDAYGGTGEDCHGHGTHVAGTAGGIEWGIAKNVDLVSVRVLDCNNSGTLSGILAGVDWITANASGPSVVNMSIVGPATSTLDQAIENSIASGIVYVVAAGNSSADACNYSPARTPSAITIGATDNSDSKASYSNYGSCIDLFAPGSSITSAYIGSDTATSQKSGTSMSAPHVTGTAALYLQNNPDATPSEVESFIISNATQDIVTQSNSQNNHLLYSVFDSGTGSENTAPSADFTFSTDNLNVQFTDGSSDSDGSIASWSWDFGDGASSTAQNPSHSYSSAGTYTVSLTVADDAGATDTVSKSLTVEEQTTNSAPSADFTYSSDFLNVQFTDGSSDSDGSVVNWSWNLGDGSSSALQNPSHSYSSPGTYEVSLTVTDDVGDSDSITKSITVNEESTEEAPVVDSFSMDTYKSGPWNRVDVSWSVSDVNSNLSSVKTELLNGTTVLETLTSSVSGGSDSGIHGHKTRGNADAVRMTVTDSKGNITSLTKNLGDSNTDEPSTTDPAEETISLTANGYKNKGQWTTDLSWNGATSTDVDIYRNGSLLKTLSNSGSYTDYTEFKGGGTLSYKVCEAGTSTCSNEVTVNF